MHAEQKNREYPNLKWSYQNNRENKEMEKSTYEIFIRAAYKTINYRLRFSLATDFIWLS